MTSDPQEPHGGLFLTPPALRSALGSTAVVYPAAFLVSVLYSTLFLGVAFFVVERFQATAFQIGLLNTCFALSYVTGCLASRPLIRRLSPHASMLVSTAGIALGLAALPLMGSLNGVLVLFVFLGLMTSLFWPPIMGWLSQGAEGMRLNRIMGIYNACWSSGIIIGPFLGGYLSERHVLLPLWVSLGLALATVCLATGAWLAAPPWRPDPAAPVRTEDAGPGRETPLRFPAWLGLWACFLAHAALVTVLPLAGPRDLGIGKTGVGMLLLVRAVINTGVLVTMGRTRFWHFHGGQLLAGSAALGGLLALLAAATAWMPAVTAALLPLVGVFWGHAYANSLFHGVSGSRQRASRMGIHETLLNAGSMIGSLAGGLLYERAGLAATCLLLAGFMAVVFGAQAGLLRLLQPRRPGAG